MREPNFSTSSNVPLMKTATKVMMSNKIKEQSLHTKYGGPIARVPLEILCVLVASKSTRCSLSLIRVNVGTAY